MPLQGSTSGQDERATAALKAIDLDNEMNGRAVQVRVVQGKEPMHFLAMFKGKLVIFSGGHASSFEVQQGETDQLLTNNYLLQVRGNLAHNTKAIQVLQFFYISPLLQATKAKRIILYNQASLIWGFPILPILSSYGEKK